MISPADVTSIVLVVGLVVIGMLGLERWTVKKTRHGLRHPDLRVAVFNNGGGDFPFAIVVAEGSIELGVEIASYDRRYRADAHAKRVRAAIRRLEST